MDPGVGESTNASVVCDAGNFECNICFELAQEPIVTLCGHLYCWSCLNQWLRFHSHSHECPICKAIVQEEKLIPIYRRGEATYDPRSRPIHGVSVPFRPPQTAPHIDMNYARPTGVDPMMGSRFGHQTLSSLFALPHIFNLQVHRYHDATVYGTTSGVPHWFSSFYVHGFGRNYHSVQMEWKPVVWKIAFMLLGFLILLHLIVG